MSYGSVNNLIFSGAKSAEPTVGLGATTLSWTDRNPWVVTQVRSPSRIFAREVEHGPYSLGYAESDLTKPIGPEVEFTRRKNGRWVRKGEGQKNGTVILFGHADCYRDPGF